MNLSWEKTLSKSDAQQETKGSRMPFLRLTGGDTDEDYKTWFRSNFFSNLAWSPGVSSQERQREVASVTLHVTIDGTDHGMREMNLNHDEVRPESHSAPATHLHYDAHTRQVLEETNLAGHLVRLRRDGDDYYFEVL